MFASKTNENRRLYRYPTQPDPQSLLNATNILKEVTNSYETTIQNQDKRQNALLKNSEEIQKSDQKENAPQHMAHPSVVIKNTTQNYKSMIENVPNFTGSNCSTLHSHSNSNGSTVSHVRSASDADSVVFLGPEDSSSNGGQTSIEAKFK